MRKLNSSLAAVAAFILTGCATSSIHTYTPPETPNSAIVKGSWIRESAFVWKGFTVVSVDDKFVGKNFWTGQPDGELKVQPGERRIVVRAHFNQGWGTGPYEALVSLRGSLKSGVSYQIKGQVNDSQVELWLEDDVGKDKATEVFSASYGKAAPGPVTIPIYVPVRR